MTRCGNSSWAGGAAAGASPAADNPRISRMIRSGPSETEGRVGLGAKLQRAGRPDWVRPEAVILPAPADVGPVPWPDVERSTS